jgi:dipeptidyl aminopeptidase/acylaminoacyl peptidase
MRRAGVQLPLFLLFMLLCVLPACGDQVPQGTLTFAAGGSIYALDLPHTNPRLVIPGDRDDPSRWASAPALAPDGSAIAFARDGDLWIADRDGTNERRIVDRDTDPSPSGASHFKLGVQTSAWSPDGERLAFVVARLGGSGLAELWVTDRRGLDPVLENFSPSGVGLVAGWLDGRPVMHPPVPQLSPNGDWIATFAAEELRIEDARFGRAWHRVNLLARGGRDHHFAEGCGGTGCSYRPPTLSWVR